MYRQTHVSCTFLFFTSQNSNFIEKNSFTLSLYKDKDSVSPLQINVSHFNTQFWEQNTVF